jgi:hypothetical protein
MTEGMDFTDARVRVEGVDVWIRVGGKKTTEDTFPFLISEAETQYRAAKGINGATVC